MNARTSRTIEELEGVGEPAPEEGATYLVRQCWELRRKPLSEFTTEDLRIMLGQQIALPILLPMAVTVLADDPLAEGDYYPGDLLHAVVRLPRSAWEGATRDRERLVGVLRTLGWPEDGAASDLRTAVADFVGSAPA